MSNVRRPRRPRRLSRRNMHRLMRPEPLESRLLLASDWQNSLAPLDVNHDQHVTSGDALSVVNDVNRNGARVLAERSEAEAGGRPASVDVNGDGAASASDVLSVINYLNGEAEDGAFLQYRIAIFDSNDHSIRRVFSLFGHRIRIGFGVRRPGRVHAAGPHHLRDRAGHDHG